MKNYRLEVRNLHKRFPGVYAIKGVSFQVAPGEVHALVGENGAGKSTLMKMITGEYTPDEGEIFHNGEQIKPKSIADSQKKGISMIHQELAPLPDMTIADNIFLGQEIMNGKFLNDHEMIEQTKDILREYGMDFDPRLKVGRLSVAQIQMLEIIKAVRKNADIIIMAACGERANEVVEIFTEFPELEDPRSGRKLYERTTIIANTSNMPVAAREASVYTAMTIGEYYRSMGMKVLLLADSTSRWAQALREMSNRMEELPGQDAFPMDLSAIISNFYARAGMVYLNNGKTGSVTFIGTVSPAGGNLKEPVTESTKKVARCFYALSQARADAKRYPAIDTLESYSKYLEYPEFIEFAKKNISDTWIADVNEARNMLVRGRETAEQIDILGDDGVPLEYHVVYWKSELIDFVILQQDAFDNIDGSTAMERQKYMLNMVLGVVRSEFNFDTFEEINPYFKRIINGFKQMNYSEYQSEAFKKYEAEVNEIINERKNN